MQRLVRSTRKSGFAELPDFRSEETNGVGCAFRLSRNSYAGISIAAINSRMPAQRRRELGAQLMREVHPFAWVAGPEPLAREQ